GLAPWWVAQRELGEAHRSEQSSEPRQAKPASSAEDAARGARCCERLHSVRLRGRVLIPRRARARVIAALGAAVGSVVEPFYRQTLDQTRDLGGQFEQRSQRGPAGLLRVGLRTHHEQVGAARLEALPADRIDTLRFGKKRSHTDE
ncbi:MAG: hypothetical protein ACYTFT_06225, partial [Planctomycetota bacterium]